MRQPLKEGTRHLRLSSLLSGMRLDSLWIKECSSSKSASCRIGSMRNEKTYSYFSKTLSKSARHAHMAEELKRELVMSIVASSRIERSSPQFSIEPARTWLQPPCSFVTCPSHQTPRPIESVMKSKDSSRPLPCSRPRVLPPGDAGLPRSNLRCPPVRREASVHPERAQRNKAVSIRERIIDNHEPRDACDNIIERRSHKHGDGAARGYHEHRGGRYDSSEDRSPSPEPPGPRVFSKAIRETIHPARFLPP
jgi:hypothetical protein